jgi:hypothetical protein
VIFALLLQSTQAFTVLQGDRVVGEAYVNERLTESGGKTQAFRIEIGEGKAKVRIRQETTIDSEARVVRKYFEQTGPGNERRSVLATLDDRGAQFTEDRNGTRKADFVRLPVGGIRRNPAELWFLATAPEVGAQSTFANFDLVALTWNDVTTKYLGFRAVDGRGLRYRAVETTQGARTAVTHYDEQGQIFAITESNGRRYRRAGKA